MISLHPYTTERCLELYEEALMPIETDENGQERDYTAPSPRGASIMPYSNDHRGAIAGYKVFDKHESIVAHLYAADSDVGGNVCRTRAQKIKEMLDNE